MPGDSLKDDLGTPALRLENIRQHIGGDTVTLADLAGHRATLLQGPRLVGTGPEVAGQMEGWFGQDRLRRPRTGGDSHGRRLGAYRF